MGITGDCSGGMHSMCPGYYRIAHPCQCPCHKPRTSRLHARHDIGWHNPDCECPCHEVIADGLVPCPECDPL